MKFRTNKLVKYSITNWLKFLYALLIIYVINKVLKIPYITEAKLNELLLQHIPGNRLEITAFTIQKLRFFNIIFQSVQYFFLCCLYSFLLFICIFIFDKNTRYFRILPVFIICESLLCLSELVNTGINYLIGFENTITHLNTLKIGLNIFTNQNISEDIYLLFYAINPFLIVFFYLLTLGINEITNLKKSKLFVISIIYTVLRISIPILLF